MIVGLLFLLLLVNGKSLNVNTMYTEPQNNSTLCTESEIWGTLVEDWALNLKKNRSDRVLKMPTEDTFILVHGTESDSTGREKISSTSPTNTPMYQISDTDLYLLGAIEKLAHRTQILEKRIKTLEEMFHYSLIGKEIIRDPCPKSFIRIGTQCYFFSVKQTEGKNWKNASKFCKENTAVLLEMETVEENQDVVNYIQTHTNLRGKDFWTGGLNPGLLWIWSNSARPVFTSKNYLSESRVDGRCLRLTYNTKYGSYMYGAADCSTKLYYICKIPDKTTSSKLNMLAKEHNVPK